MLRIKRLLGVGWLVGLVAALAFAVPAQAEVKAACVVAGNVKVSPSVQVIGGKGSFIFEDLLTVCAGVAKGAPVIGSYDVSAAGGFKDLVCGTGKAIGSVSDSSSFADKVIGDKFAVEFVGTAGQFYWHDGDWAKQVLSTKILEAFPLFDQKPDTSKTWALAGYVGLLPPPPPENLGGKPILPLPDFLAGECTKAFGVVGVVLIDTLE